MKTSTAQTIAAYYDFMVQTRSRHFIVMPDCDDAPIEPVKTREATRDACSYCDAILPTMAHKCGNCGAAVKVTR